MTIVCTLQTEIDLKHKTCVVDRLCIKTDLYDDDDSAANNNNCLGYKLYLQFKPRDIRDNSRHNHNWLLCKPHVF
jgi:hypothetical protein